MTDSGRALAGCGIVDESNSVDIAQGILMERYEVSSQVAFDILVRHAAGCQVPVIEIARWLIATRYLP